MYEILIIGAGPAGLAAALYGARAGRKILLLEEKSRGGQMAETGTVENMPFLPDAAGWELTERFARQVEALGVETRYQRAVTLTPGENRIQVQTEGGDTYTARRVILAMGVRRRRLNVPGEERLKGKGVSWCAVCDGAFFRGKDVAVVGGGNTALEDALYLSGVCNRVFLLIRRDTFRGQALLAKRVRDRKNIEILRETQIREIHGAQKVSGITVVQRGNERYLAVSGVFIAIGLQPEPALYRDVVETTPEGYIAAGEDCRTSCPGMFAAGDIRRKEIRQIVTALSDGAVAAELAGRDL